MRHLYFDDKQLTSGKKGSNTHFYRERKLTYNATLVTKVTLKNGKPCFYPIKYYCSNSIIDELEKLVFRKDFPINWELWRKREVGNLG